LRGSYRKNWRDTKKKQLENLLDSFMGGLEAISLRRKEHIREEEEKERERHEQQRQREEKAKILAEKKRQIEAEQSRVDNLMSEAENWKKSQIKACKNLGIKGIDLYGGTKHSTATALGEFLTPEQIKRGGTGSATNKAFERYFQPRRRESAKVVSTIKELQKKQVGKVVKMRK
jgi:hypothetical protein